MPDEPTPSESEVPKKGFVHMDTSIRIAAPFLLVGFVTIWCHVYEQMVQNVDRSGVQGFFCYLILCVLVVAAKMMKPLPVLNPAGIFNKLLCLGTAACAITFIYIHVHALIIVYNSVPGADFARNTWTAEEHQFDHKEDPYATNSEFAFDPSQAPHVTKVNGQLYMFGVPYYRGYAYFPAMFWSYEPFRRINPRHPDLKIGNAFFYVLTVIGVAWLAALLTPPGWRMLAALVAVTALVGTQFIGQAYFFEEMTDVVIAAFAIWGWVAAYYNRPVVSGALFGWAFASKLVPGAFICLIMCAWFWRRPDRWKFVGAMVLTFLAIMLPYVLWNPGAFLSATVLYYLTEHASGDGTALYYYLPTQIQPFFLIAGYLLVLWLLYRSISNKTLTLLDTVGNSFVIFAIFIAFSKMAHLNYVLSVLPVGGVAMAAYALKKNPSQTDGVTNSEIDIAPNLQPAPTG
jgi:hypothetical protein